MTNSSPVIISGRARMSQMRSVKSRSALMRPYLRINDYKNSVFNNFTPLTDKYRFTLS